MRPIVLIQVEGVLANAEDPALVVEAAPIASGTTLYHALDHTNTIMLCTMARRLDRLEHWCIVHGYKHHVNTFGSRVGDFTPEDTWMRQINTVRLLGPVSLVVTADPNLASMSLQEGVPTLLLAHPAYMSPLFRPDATNEPRPWDMLKEAVEAQAVAYAKDERRKGHSDAVQG